MTVNEYLEDLKNANLNPIHPGQPSFIALSLDATEIWSNDACKGYLIKAAQSVGLNWEQINHLLYAVGGAFNTLTVDEAEKVYQNF